MERRYTIVIEPDQTEAMYTVTVPALPGCVTQGATVEQCIHRAREAVAAWIADAEAIGEPVPDEIEPARAITIVVAA